MRHRTGDTSPLSERLACPRHLLSKRLYMHRMSFLREQCMHRCILSPFSEMLHAKAVGTDTTVASSPARPPTARRSPGHAQKSARRPPGHAVDPLDAWFLGCASDHPSGKHNTTVASPTVPSRLGLNYHPFRQEVSIQASWAYINVTIQA